MNERRPAEVRCARRVVRRLALRQRSLGIRCPTTDSDASVRRGASAGRDCVRRAGAGRARRRRAPERADSDGVSEERSGNAASVVPARQPLSYARVTGGGLRSHDAATGLPSPGSWSRRVTSNVGQNYPYTSETEAERAAAIVGARRLRARA